MARLSEATRQQVFIRANGCCEYCQTQRRIVIWMTIDHIEPRAIGGTDHLDNLCLCCPNCNLYKTDSQFVLDPQTQEVVMLFNPRIDHWTDHFAWDDEATGIVGLTPMGRATIEQLRMNLPEIVQARRNWVAVGWHPPSD